VFRDERRSRTVPSTEPTEMTALSGDFPLNNVERPLYGDHVVLFVGDEDVGQVMSDGFPPPSCKAPLRIASIPSNVPTPTSVRS